VVGGGTVELTLMLAGTPLRAQVFAAFEVINGVLIIVSSLLVWRAAHNLGVRHPPPLILNSILPGVGVSLWAFFCLLADIGR